MGIELLSYGEEMEEPIIKNEAEKTNEGYLISWLKNLYSFYKWFFIVFSIASFLYGYLYYMAYQDEIGISDLSIPIESVYSQFIGAFNLIIEYWLHISCVLALLSWALFCIPLLPKWLRKGEFYWYGLVFVLCPFIPIVISHAILRPIEKGGDIAQAFKSDSTKLDLIITPLDSGKADSIQCKLIHFDGSYAVYMLDSIPIAKSFPTGTIVIPNFYKPKKKDLSGKCEE